MAHHHRSGGQKQSNKRHKTNNASKRSISRKSGGKIAQNPKTRHVANIHKSAANKSKVKQHQKHMRQAKLEAARRRLPGALLYDNSSIQGGVVNVGLISLSPPSGLITSSDGSGLITSERMEHYTSAFLLQQMNTTFTSTSNTTNTTTNAYYGTYQKTKCRVLTTSDFIRKSNLNGNDNDADMDENSCNNDHRILAALDLARVCQVLIFLLHADDDDDDSNNSNHNYDDVLLSETGERVLHAIKAQGLPSKCFALLLTSNLPAANLPSSSVRLKKMSDLKKYANRLVTTEIAPSVKLFDLCLNTCNNNNDADDGIDHHDKHTKAQISLLMRSISNGSAMGAKWVCIRPFVVSDSIEYNSENEELVIQGYVHGNVPFNIQDLIHIPYMGTFQAKLATYNTSAGHYKKNHKKRDIVMEGGAVDDVIMQATNVDSLSMFATPDALDGEQNLIGFDDDSMNHGDDDFEEDNDKDPGNTSARPSMWSDYQASWLEGVPQEKVEELLMDDEDAEDLDTVSDPFNRKTSNSSIVDDSTINLTKQQFREEANFPDEIELPHNVAARTRLERYRSLSHFKDSPWDPMEQLPDAYGKLYAFGGGFKSVERDVLESIERRVTFLNNEKEGPAIISDEAMNYNSADESSDKEEASSYQKCIPTGSYLTLILQNVTSAHIERAHGLKTLTAVGLLKHENKASLCHMNVQMGNTCEPGDVPVKSKDVLTIRCGWRTWQCRPIFSENNLNADKHKFSRFLSPHSHLSCSAYGPVTFGNTPVLIFREPSEPSSRRQLVAVGTSAIANPNRIIIKRAILTGYPTRVHKRHAVVRYMFFNPDDVKWFQPAQLTTKHGLVGNIVESVGEHGTMKCLFNKGVQQHDTICLVLYKRVYPKYVDKEGDGDDLLVL